MRRNQLFPSQVALDSGTYHNNRSKLGQKWLSRVGHYCDRSDNVCFGEVSQSHIFNFQLENLLSAQRLMSCSMGDLKIRC